MTKEEILAKFTARQRQIPEGLTIPEYFRRTIEAMHEVAAEVLADKPVVEELKMEVEGEIEVPAAEVLAFLIMCIGASILVWAGYSYYALTLFVLFLIIYLLVKGFGSWRA